MVGDVLFNLSNCICLISRPVIVPLTLRRSRAILMDLTGPVVTTASSYFPYLKLATLTFFARVISNDDIEELVEVFVHIHRLPGVRIDYNGDCMNLCPP